MLNIFLNGGIRHLSESLQVYNFGLTQSSSLYLSIPTCVDLFQIFQYQRCVSMVFKFPWIINHNNLNVKIKCAVQNGKLIIHQEFFFFCIFKVKQSRVEIKHNLIKRQGGEPINESAPRDTKYRKSIDEVSLIPNIIFKLKEERWAQLCSVSEASFVT